MVSKQRIISALSTTPLADNSFDAFDEKHNERLVLIHRL